MLILAAAGLITFGMFAPKPKEEPPAEAQTTPAPAERTPAGSVPAPEPTPLPTPEPTPDPKPDPAPVLEAVLIRSSMVYYGSVRFSAPERIIEAGMRLWDRSNEVTAREHTFTREEIDSGSFRIEKLDANVFAKELMEQYGSIEHDPELILETTVTFRTQTGEETLTEQIEAEAVPWVGVNFDTEEDVGGVLEWMYGTVYPNRFVVRIEDAPSISMRVVFGDDPAVLEKGDVLITITVDGAVLTGEFKPVEMFAGRTYYYIVYAVPVPDTFPAHGTAHVGIRQRLTDHDFVFEKDSRDRTY
jgi:hypothetical protein